MRIKINIILGNAFGSMYIAMGNIGKDVAFAWPNAEIGAMEASLAAKILCDGQGAEKIAECKDAYAALQNNVNSAAARGYVDHIVAPQDTRSSVMEIKRHMQINFFIKSPLFYILA